MGIDNYFGGNIIQIKGTKDDEKGKIEISEETRIKTLKLIMEYHKDGKFDKFDEEVIKFINERLNFPNVTDDFHNGIISSLKGGYCDHITAFLILCNIEGYTKKVPEIDKLKDESDSGGGGNVEDLTGELKELFEFSIPEIPVEPLIPTYGGNIRKYYDI